MVLIHNLSKMIKEIDPENQAKWTLDYYDGSLLISCSIESENGIIKSYKAVSAEYPTTGIVTHKKQLLKTMFNEVIYGSLPTRNT